MLADCYVADFRTGYVDYLFSEAVVQIQLMQRCEEGIIGNWWQDS